MAIPCLHPFALLGRFLLPAALLLFVVQAHAGLVLHYKFDETSGTTATDSSGNGNAGILGGPTGSEWTTGKVGGALSFGDSDFVAVWGYNGITGTNARTVALWFKTSTSSSERALLAYGNVSSSGTGFILKMLATNRASFDAGASPPLTAGNDLTDGDWHHLAVTIPDNGTSGDVVLYVDGVGTNGSGSMLINTGINPPAGGVFMGGDHFQLDDVRMYDHALTAGEVSALAAGGGAGAPEPAETFAFLGLLTAFGLGFREWRSRRKAKAA